MAPAIVTPDRRLRVFVSSTLEELASERAAVRRAVTRLHLVPVMFEAGARSHPPRALYRAYLDQSDVFVGIYWERYGWTAPDMTISGLEDEYELSAGKPRLVYVKRSRRQREEGLEALLARMRDDGDVSYKPFATAAELERLVCDDLAVLLTERFQATTVAGAGAGAGAGGRDSARRPPLPADTTSFVGRTAELDEIVDLLGTGPARLVTLTGPGGIGKTRLALQAARRLEPRLADGVAFVPLAGAHDGLGVAAAVAAAFRLRDVGPEPLLAAVADHLAHLDVLLVLDGYEHLIPDVDVVTELLEQAPGARMILTSRTALRIRAEHEIPVPPLDVSGPHAPPGELEACEGVRLFVERASAVRHGFAAGADLDAVAAICRRLDGIPLALELAAAAVRLLPPKALLDHLRRRLDLPVPAPRDVPDRHRTLRHAIASSYDLCTADEQRLLARMGVFAGGCSLEALEAVGAPGGEIDVLAVAGALVDKSLLRTAAAGPEIRFRMLETVRDFALERLADLGETEAVGARHAAYYRDLCVDIDRGLRGSSSAEWLRRLSDPPTGAGDADNIRAALRWFVDHTDGDDAATMVWSLWLATWTVGSLAEGCETARAVLTGLAPMSPPARVRVQASLGLLQAWKGDYGEAVPNLVEALELARRDHDDEVVAPVLLGLGVVTAAVEGEQRGRELLRESLALFSARPDPWGQAATLSVLGWLAVALGDHDDDQLFTDGLEAARRVGDVLLVAMTTNNMADHQLALGDVEAAMRSMRESLERYRELRALYPAAYGVETAAAIAAREGDAETAALLTGAADGMRERIGVPLYGAAGAAREAFVAGLERELGAGRFGEARSAGRALRFDEAIDVAMSAVGGGGREHRPAEVPS